MHVSTANGSIPGDAPIFSSRCLQRLSRLEKYLLWPLKIPQRDFEAVAEESNIQTILRDLSSSDAQDDTFVVLVHMVLTRAPHGSHGLGLDLFIGACKVRYILQVVDQSLDDHLLPGIISQNGSFGLSHRFDPKLIVLVVIAELAI